MGQRLADGLTKVFDEAEIPGTVNRMGSMLTGFFSPGPVSSLNQVEQADTAAYGRYFHAMLERGIYLAPSQFEAGFVSLAHTEADALETLSAAKDLLRSLRRLRSAAEKGNLADIDSSIAAAQTALAAL